MRSLWGPGEQTKCMDAVPICARRTPPPKATRFRRADSCAPRRALPRLRPTSRSRPKHRAPSNSTRAKALDRRAHILRGPPQLVVERERDRGPQEPMRSPIDALERKSRPRASRSPAPRAPKSCQRTSKVVRRWRQQRPPRRPRMRGARRRPRRVLLSESPSLDCRGEAAVSSCRRSMNRWALPQTASEPVK